MKERNITVTLDKAKEWFNSGNATLREVALQAFNKDELICDFFRRITTFRRACEALRVGYITTISAAENIAYYSKASAAMFKLNIIRKALNLGHDLSLTRGPRDSYVHYPYNPLITNSSTFYDNDISLGNMELIVKLRVKEKNIRFLVAPLLMVVMLALVSSTLVMVWLMLMLVLDSLVVQQKRLQNTLESISECLSLKPSMRI